MSMPYIDDDLEAEEEVVESFEIEGSDLAFDGADIIFSDGDAETIDGEDALQQWINKAFMTRAYVYDIYDPEETTDSEDDEDEYDDEEDIVYGSKLKEILIDPDMPRILKLANIQQDIERVLLAHPDIASVTDFDFTQSQRDLVVTFTAITSYGNSPQEVIIDVADSE